MTEQNKDAALFSAQHHDADTKPCPRCDGQLRIKHIGQNSFWGCSNYPACDYTRSLQETSDFEPQPLPDAYCPKCEQPLLLKKGRFGFFIGCSSFPECDYIADPDAEEEQGALADCPQCGKGSLIERSNKYGKVFYPCDAYPKCRYALNDKPVAQACPECGWPVLVEKKSAAGVRLKCPQKSCSYSSEPL